MRECPKCGDNLSVVDSRLASQSYSYMSQKALRRRRACKNCGYRFTTYEMSERVIKELFAAKAQMMLMQGVMTGTAEIAGMPKINNTSQVIKYLTKDDQDT